MTKNPIQAYKRKLYRDWLNGMTVEKLAEKYSRSVFKVNLIIEKLGSKNG